MQSINTAGNVESGKKTNQPTNQQKNQPEKTTKSLDQALAEERS